MAGPLVLLAQFGDNLLCSLSAFYLRLVDEVDGIHQVQVVLIDQSRIFSKLHQIGSLKQFFQLIDHLLVSRMLQAVDNLRRGHLHSIEPKPLIDILTDGIGQLGVVRLLVFRRAEMRCLDLVN